MTEFEQVFSVKQVADILGVGRETARLLLEKEAGVMCFKGRGKGVRFHRLTPLSVLRRIQRRFTQPEK